MKSQMQRKRGAILAAACALPGVAAAETAPTEGLVGWKYLYYRESRDWIGTVGANDPTKDPLTISSPSVYAFLPLSSRFTVEGGLVYDSLSGATPRAYTSVVGASKMKEERIAADLKGTMYFRRAAVGAALTYSTENDYKSTALAIDTRLSTDDNNTVFAFGVGHSRDEINASDEVNLVTNAQFQNKKKNVTDTLVGVTQVLSPNDVLKFNVTYSRGRGFFSDPYKADKRPEEKNVFAALLQWNHHFAGSGSTLRSSYRFYNDSYKVTAHTVGFDYVAPLGAGWQLTPGLRYYTQSAASFYLDPVVSAGGNLGLPDTTNVRFYSFDHRLASYGAITLGSKIAFRWGHHTVDFRYDYYVQSTDFRLLEEGSPNLADYRAHMFQVGYAYRF